jgi:hypothetical protein
MEAGRFASGWLTGILESNRHVRDVLEAKGTRSRALSSTEGTTRSLTRKPAGRGLIALTTEGQRP